MTDLTPSQRAQAIDLCDRIQESVAKAERIMLDLKAFLEAEIEAIRKRREMRK